ncbi:MAG: hypothetical protein LN413_03845 [Candidatus Thermoplasmatota archaeon]|nr:hypothetical protein [Candidatus Thermoplasmatota archaeon]
MGWLKRRLCKHLFREYVFSGAGSMLIPWMEVFEIHRCVSCGKKFKKIVDIRLLG